MTTSGVCFRWHRLGFSVKGDAATLILDCEKQITKVLNREPFSKISVAGIFLIGQQLLDEGFFKVPEKFFLFLGRSL